MRRLFFLTVVVLFAVTFRLDAQSYAAFGFKNPSALTVPAFSTDDITQLLSTLDRFVADRPQAPDWADRAGDAFWQFARRLQTGRLSPAQETRVLEHLDRMARTLPDGEAIARGARQIITGFTVGKRAPDIVGTDLDGRPLKLSDYRRKVVVLLFSADWCAICRTQAPYERLLLDRYGKWPFALLGVEASSTRDAARALHADERLLYRAWWDEAGDGAKGGPIATAWNVQGLPATYVIDGDGIIRFVDVRDEDLLRAVRQLVNAQADAEALTATRKRR